MFNVPLIELECELVLELVQVCVGAFWRAMAAMAEFDQRSIVPVLFSKGEGMAGFTNFHCSQSSISGIPQGI